MSINIRTTVAGLLALGLTTALTVNKLSAQPSTPVFVHVTSPAPFSVLRNVSPIKPVTAIIKLTIDKGYHLQGNNAKDPYIPTTATITAPAGVTIGKITYPPSVVKEFSGEKLPVYENKVEIKVPVTVSSEVKSGTIKLPVTIKYQGCNNQSCYPPANISATISIVVGAAK